MSIIFFNKKSPTISWSNLLHHTAFQKDKSQDAFFMFKCGLYNRVEKGGLNNLWAYVSEIMFQYDFFT